MKDSDKPKRIRRALDRVNGSLDDIKKRQDEAIERFEKEHPFRLTPGIDPEAPTSAKCRPKRDSRCSCGRKLVFREQGNSGAWVADRKRTHAL